MDRFIASVLRMFTRENFYLKSNMDRFIDLTLEELYQLNHYLKSNMDRFIVCKIPINKK